MNVTKMIQKYCILASTILMGLGLVAALPVMAQNHKTRQFETSVLTTTIYHVAQSGNGTDGLSWSTAFTELQDALAVANSGDEIWVATGVYTPGLSQSDTFSLTSGVALYGGFAATETLRTERDWETNLTILSGDIAGDDSTDGNSIVTDTANINGSNSYHVVSVNGVTTAITETTVLDGFTITAGHASGSNPHNNGAGMYNFVSSPTLANLTFIGNMADSGGGLYNTVISSPSLTNVTFSGNTASSNGGGMVNFDDSFPTLTRVIFSGNTAGSHGGGMYSNNGSSSSLTNAIFSGNTAGSNGGAIYSNSGDPTLTNVTFNENSAGQNGGALYNIYNFATLDNVILWGNTASSSGSQIYTHSTFASYEINHSLMQDGDGGSNSGTAFSTGSGNINSDPLFADADGADGIIGTLDDDLRLLPLSPAIDAGNNDIVNESNDLDGNNRFYDDSDVTDSGSGTAPIVDMGAYERQSDSCAAYSVIYVNQDATGSNDGTSWDDAYSNLQDGLTLAQGCSGAEIWVATGVYTPGLSQSDTFSLTSDIALYGGFAATETLRSERDWKTNLTILSGDIAGDDITDGNSIVTDTTNINGSNSYHVVSVDGSANSITETAVLDGFTITAGDANGGEPDDRGAGMTINQGSPTLANLTFVGNMADSGGGLYNTDASNPTLTNVTFSHNTASSNGGGMVNINGSNTSLTSVTFSSNTASSGGGLYSTSGSVLTLTNVTFDSNRASADGGGLVNTSSNNPTLTNVTFSGNTADANGGGMYSGSGNNPTLTNVTFSGNSASSGGGMYNTSGVNPTLTNATFSGNMASADGGGMYSSNSTYQTLTNTVFSGNTAGADGGGMYSTISSPALINVTFSKNDAGQDGGALHTSYNDASLENAILWGNTAVSEGSQIYNLNSSIVISYSLVQGGDSGSNSGTAFSTGTGNINSDPLFVDADGADDTVGTLDDDLRLSAYSPAIDAGNNDAISESYDLDGNTRFYDDTAVTDTGSGTAPIVDMGAYEKQSSSWNLIFLPIVLKSG